MPSEGGIDIEPAISGHRQRGRDPDQVDAPPEARSRNQERISHEQGGFDPHDLIAASCSLELARIA